MQAAQIVDVDRHLTGGWQGQGAADGDLVEMVGVKSVIHRRAGVQSQIAEDVERRERRRSVQLLPAGMRVPPLLTVTAPVPGMPTAPPAELPPSVPPLLTVTVPMPVAEFCVPRLSSSHAVGGIEGPAVDDRPAVIGVRRGGATMPSLLSWASPRVSEPMLVEAKCRAMLLVEAAICALVPVINLPITASNLGLLPTRIVDGERAHRPRSKLVTPPW